MNSAAQLLASIPVLLDVDAPNKQALFEAVARLWEQRHGMVVATVVDSLNAREKLGSTGLGHGVAIPHARIKGCTEAVGAFVRLKEPIEFAAPDGKPVSYCFVLLAPERPTEQHLQILAAVAERLSDWKFRDRLGTCNSEDEVHQLLAG